ncbi:hypothetical protein AWC38_SpisGene7031 [Stylophora pistillata]|uniref:Uncharacterized protein n=1 Tax=Stylophora pistillata TaxID=50429 RepID=A0A2B4SIE3_STYPI|nr:hypothetical protein AWC38_SpisGene7031 [Stylophora pistillata]
MRDWASAYGAAVRQRTVRQETTMAKHGTLPEYIYQRHCIRSDQPTNITFEEADQGEEDGQESEGPGEDSQTEEQVIEESGSEPEYDGSSDEDDIGASDEGGNYLQGEIGSSITFLLGARGGARENIEDDLAQEISNRCSRNIVQRLGPNKSLNSISKVCKATTGIHQIVEQFDPSVGIPKTSVQHTTCDSLKDEKEMVNDILHLNPFNHVPGRSHDSFPDIKRSPLRYLNIIDYHQWLAKHMGELST